MKRIALFSCLALLMLSAASLFASPERRYEGRPSFHARLPRRYVIWEQRGVFHLRTTTAAALNQFQAVIFASDGAFSEVRRVRIDAGDWVRRSRDGRRIYSSFVTRGGVDGLDFRTDAARISFRLRINGREAAPRAEIFLGRSGRHPSNNPFVLYVKEADRDEDGVGLEFQEPAKDDLDVLEVVPAGELEEESRGAD
jgi:hypothetical protein